MSHIIADRVRDSTTTVGVNPLALSGIPPTRYQSFDDVCNPGDTIWVATVHRTANEWEVAKVTFNGSSLTRTNVLASSNAAAFVNFSAGVKDIVAVEPASAIYPFPFTSSQQGLVPASGGGSVNFLRADGTWASPGGGAPAQRSVTSSPIIIGPTDQILTINIASGSPTCALPASATRNGLPLTFKDVGNQFFSHNLTITPNGAETIDGLATLVLQTNYQSVTLYPFNDGVHSGWFMS